MMRSLQGVLSASELEMVTSSVSLRFKDHTKFRTPEALIIHEQKLLSGEELLECCNKEYGRGLEVPQVHYLPRDIVQHFGDHNCIPIRYDSLEEAIHVGVLPENERDYIPPYRHTKTIKHLVPIHYFVDNYINMYSSPKFLYRIPAKDLFDFIVNEAVGLGAADITISNKASKAEVYYNVKKRKIRANRQISRDDIKDIVNLICTMAGSPDVEGLNDPKYISVRLDAHNRGRVVLNETYYGKSMTIRVLSDELLTTTLEELNIEKKTRDFIRSTFLSMEPGLRILIGPTMSGKNTTILSGLKEILDQDIYKVVSVEYPVEQLVDNMEQINCESEREYALATESLIRQNPDIVYISEITDMTALSTLKIANTGKVVYSAIHANSISDVIARLQDLTKLSSDRILMNLQSAIYQNLVRTSDGELKPETNCLYFSEELKEELIGKSMGEVHSRLRKEERKWSLTDTVY